VVVGGAAGTGYALTRDKGRPAGQGGSPTATATATLCRQVSPTERDFRCANVGDCLVNKGTYDKPELHITACVAGDKYQTYQVLKRFNDTVDESKCNGVTELGTRYHYDDHAGTKLVYCLKKID
jgi:hypothetical protein